MTDPRIAGKPVQHTSKQERIVDGSTQGRLYVDWTSDLPRERLDEITESGARLMGLLHAKMRERSE